MVRKVPGKRRRRSRARGGGSPRRESKKHGGGYAELRRATVGSLEAQTEGEERGKEAEVLELYMGTEGNITRSSRRGLELRRSRARFALEEEDDDVIADVSR